MDVNYQYTREVSTRDWEVLVLLVGTVFLYRLALMVCAHIGASGDFIGGWGLEPLSRESMIAFEEGDLRRDIALNTWISILGGQSGIVKRYSGYL